MEHFKEKDREYIAGTYNRFDVELVSGSGAEAYDINEKKYIDLGSGIAVNTFGIADREWRDAVVAQLDRIQHTSNLYYSEPCVKLAELLCQKSGMKKVFFGNSGAEANEGAIKTARKYYSDNHGGKTGEIITLTGGFHGRTITTLSATGQDVFHKDFGPFTDGFKYVPANDCEALLQAVGENTAAVMLELIQGEGGVNVLSREFVDCVKSAADKYGFLIIADEVQTGNGRTGKYFASEHFGLQPDIITTAKGLGGGLPIGAVLLGEKVADTLGAGDHGSTFGGNPAVCAGAVSIVSRINSELLSSVAEKGEYIRQELLKFKGVKSVSGMGLMIGIETEKDAKQIAVKALENGVLILTAKTKLRMLPPLNITKEQIDSALDILREVIEQ